MVLKRRPAADHHEADREDDHDYAEKKNADVRSQPILSAKKKTARIRGYSGEISSPYGACHAEGCQRGRCRTHRAMVFI